MILFVGDVGGDFRDREAFQEVDFTAMFRPLAKWVERIDDVDRIPEYVARAYQIATSGRRGPVVLALPEDMLARESKAADAKPYAPREPHPGREAMERFRQLLAAAKSPLVILGGRQWTREACNDMQRFVEANALPVRLRLPLPGSLRQPPRALRGRRGHRHQPGAGRAREAGRPPAGRGRAPGRDDHQRLHAARFAGAAAEARARARRAPRRSGACSSRSWASSRRPRISRAPARPWSPSRIRAWKGSAGEARADFVAWTARREMPGPRADVGRGRLPQPARARGHDLHQRRGQLLAAGCIASIAIPGWRTQLAPTSGAMGYGVPAAIAAKIARPERTVVCFAGDGDFLMTGQELATAAQYDAPVDRDRGEQRHLRHDPHAPGEALSRGA